MTPAVAQLASLQPFAPAVHRLPAPTGCFPRQTSAFAEAAEVFAVVLLICLDTPACPRTAPPTQMPVVFRLLRDNQSVLRAGWSRLCDQAENPAGAGSSFGFDP